MIIKTVFFISSPIYPFRYIYIFMVSVSVLFSFVTNVFFFILFSRWSFSLWYSFYFQFCLHSVFLCVISFSPNIFRFFRLFSATICCSLQRKYTFFDCIYWYSNWFVSNFWNTWHFVTFEPTEYRLNMRYVNVNIEIIFQSIYSDVNSISISTSAVDDL